MKTAAILDVCTSDYFRGYHKPVLTVGLSGYMTNSDLADAIQDELNLVYDLIESGHTEDEIKLFDDLINNLRVKGSEMATSKLYEDDEDDYFEDGIYAYIGIINPVTVHGLTFLNP